MLALEKKTEEICEDRRMKVEYDTMNPFLNAIEHEFAMNVIL